MNALWPGSFVEEGSLSQNIFILRRLLGDDRNGNSFIQTVPRKGYRFVASVQETDAATMGNGLSGAPHSALLADYWVRHSPFCNS
jgi:DNA-binding winged helix-turn-helix (wHTH) protein